VTRAAAAALSAVVLAFLGAGCSASEGTEGGGKIVGETVTVYSLMPLSGPRSQVARDLVAGQKLALADAGERAAALPLKVNFVSLDSGPDADPERVSKVARQAMKDPQVIAVIADLDSASARITVPLFNAAGLLHVSPGATYTGFVAPGAPGEPERWRPSGRATFAATAPTDAAQAVAIAGATQGRVVVEAGAEPDSVALAEAVRARVRGRSGPVGTVVYAGTDPDDAIGVVGGLLDERPRARIVLPEALLRADVPAKRFASEARVRFLTSAPPAAPAFDSAFETAFGRPPATAYARVGYDAMHDVISAIAKAGARAGDRTAVIDAYFSTRPLSRTATLPFRLTRFEERP